MVAVHIVVVPSYVPKS